MEWTGKDILAHELTKYIFPIHKVILGNETKIEDGVLTVRKTLEEDAKGAKSDYQGCEGRPDHAG